MGAHKTQTKRKPPKTAWKPGQSGNPAGTAKLPADIKESREILKESFERLGFKLTQASLPELAEIVDAPNTPAWEVIIARLVYNAALGGDDSRKELLNRLIGKVKEEVDLNATGTFTFTDFVRIANSKKV